MAQKDLMDANEFLEAVGIKVKHPKICMRGFEDTPPKHRVDSARYSSAQASAFLGGKGSRTDRSVCQDTPETIEATHLEPEQLERLYCGRCHRDAFHLTSPACWPITVVAVTCSHCGRVKGYFDEQVSATLLEIDDKHDMPPRESMIAHRRYKPIMPEDQLRALVIEGFKLKIELDQIAEDLDTTPEYVHSVGVNSGYIRRKHFIKVDDVERRARKIAAMRKEGRKNMDICKELGFSNATLQYYIRKFKMPRKDRQGNFVN